MSRDPFTPQTTSAGTTTAAAAAVSIPAAIRASLAAAVTGGTGAASAGGAGGFSSLSITPPTGIGSWGSPSAPGGGSAPGSTVTVVTPSQPASASTGQSLTATETYQVGIAYTGPSGNETQINPFERLRSLPSDQEPLVVDLGVLQGGGKVLFAVQPGTSLSGPGACLPGALDCQLVALGQGQTEQLSTPSGNAYFAVTSIKVDRYTSVAAADAARQQADPAGAKLLANSTLDALSLFPYVPGVGAIVDERNLTVGGN